MTELFNNKGGIETYNQQLIEAVSQSCEGSYCKVFVLNDAKFPASFGQNVEVIPCASTPYRLIWKVRMAAKAILHSLTRKPDMIVCGHINLLPLCLLLKRFFGIEYVMNAYGIEVWQINNARTKKAITQARKIISISQYTKNRLLDQLPLAPDTIDLLPCTVDTLRFTPQEKKMRLLKHYQLQGFQSLLTVGRLSLAENYKGFDVVMRALPEVLRVKPNVKYLIVGKGNALDSLQYLARELRIEANVIFTGFVPDEELVDYYNLCDAFVMPSKGEGFGIVFLEALACGKPVIAGNADGARDPLLDGKLGVLVDPNNSTEVAQAILRLLDEENREPLRNPEYLRQQVIEHFGIERFRKRVAELFEKLSSSETS